MIGTIYQIILVYFLLGGIGFYLINRKRDREVAKKSYLKFATYFVIIHILFFSITVKPVVFRWLALLITGTGALELFMLFRRSGYAHKQFFGTALLLFILFSAGFIGFSRLEKELILFAFLVLSIFDSFSQITGQLWGRKKILPEISPNKTRGGLLGGTVIALASALLLRPLCPDSVINCLLMAAGIAGFAFAGDVAASWYKRNYHVKDYSHLIPGHGGVLDRFDSLIAGGAWVAFSVHVLNF